MATTHKSKYKNPKDLEKSTKPKLRKDIKDYVEEDKNGTMVPNSTGKKQTMVPRKDDKKIIDDVENMVPNMTDKDRTYKNLETGDYDPKYAAKYFDKIQKQDTEEYLEKLKNIDHGVIVGTELQEKLDRLSEENKDRLVREYIRRKIALMIREQAADQKALSDTPAPAPAPEAPAIPADESDIDVETPEIDKDPQEAVNPETLFIKYLKQKGPGIDMITAVIKTLESALRDADADKKISVYKMLQNYAVVAKNKMGAMQIKEELSDQPSQSELKSDMSHLEMVTKNLKLAIADAQRISDEEGVTQHVNHTGNGKFDVSNWYDSDNTVASYEAGQRIN